MDKYSGSNVSLFDPQLYIYPGHAPIFSFRKQTYTSPSMLHELNAYLYNSFVIQMFVNQIPTQVFPEEIKI